MGKLLIRFAPWVATFALAMTGAFGLSVKAYIGKSNEVAAEIERCNTRMSDSAREHNAAVTAAREEAREQADREWAARVEFAESVARDADAARQMESERAEQLQREIDDLYRQDDQAYVWGDTALPDAVFDRVRPDAD